MTHEVTIGGVKVELAWTQDIARRFPYRASIIGGSPTSKELTNPRTAAAAVTKLLWLFLPPAVHSLYPTPEDLFVNLNHEEHAEEVSAAVRGMVEDMAPSDEKKSTSENSPSPESNSG
jgi:hypothetical protein